MVVTQQADSATVDCRFLFGNADVDAVLRDALAQDARGAKLSPAFRMYYRVRSMIPLPVRQLLQRYRPVKESPDWFYQRPFLEALAAACERAPGACIATIHPWPDGARFAFVPTHDVETSEGMRNIERIADLEEQLGFRSSWNIVPHKYPVDRGLLCDLQRRGFEIGVHGYNHDGKLFTSRKVFNRRVPAINAALTDFSASGFRAPMVHRNLDWLQQLDVEYDASYFDVDPYQAMPGGVGGVWPYMAGRFVELPYTLAQDHTLFVALDQRDGRIWEEKLDFVARLGGMALFITHPDYLDSDYRVDAYRHLLEKARAMDGMWHALPRQVAAWWRERDSSVLSRNDSGEWKIDGPAANRGRVASLSVSSEARAVRSGAEQTPSSVPASLPQFEWRDLPMSSAIVGETASPTFV